MMAAPLSRSRASLCVLIAAFLTAVAASPAAAGARRVIILAVPGLSASDLASPVVPALGRLARESALGWMNTRTARVPGRPAAEASEAAAYLTLNAGSRAAAGPDGAAPNAIEMAALQRANVGLDHPVPIGALGDLIHAAGLRTVVRGTEDTATANRSGRLLLIDSSGHIDDDRTDRAGLPSPDAPFGQTDDLAAYDAPDGAVTLWVFGDLARADQYAPLCLPDVAVRHRLAALRRLDRLIAERLLPLGDVPCVLLAPTPAQRADAADRLAPVLLRAVGLMPAGILRSGSTHLSGLMANTDLLPTLAAWLGVPTPRGAIGRAATAAGPPASPADWAALHTHWVRQSQGQAALGGLPTVQFVIVLLAACAVALRLPGARRVLAAAGLAVTAIPLLELLLPLAAGRGPVVGQALVLALALACAGAVGAWRPDRCGSAAGFFLSLFAGLALIDLATGARLMQGAWMSYSVMEGARYYGIGNEYCGALTAAGLLVAAAFLRRRPAAWPWVTAVLFAAAALIGLPMAGANAGGLLGAVIGFGVAACTWWRGRFSLRAAATAVAAAVALLLLMLALDLARGSGQQTHIAHAVTFGGGLGGIVMRKAQMNGYLLLHSPWSLALFASLLMLAWQWRQGLADDVRALPGLFGAAAGLGAGAIALFVFNDSGVVAAAELALVAWAGAACHLAAQPGRLDKSLPDRHTVRTRASRGTDPV